MFKYGHKFRYMQVNLLQKAAICSQTRLSSNCLEESMRLLSTIFWLVRILSG